MSAVPLQLQVGGALDPERHLYIKRPQDDELLEGLLAGRYCSILSARQMGKSSLIMRTARLLGERQIRATICDLAPLAATPEPDTWYCAVLRELTRQIGPKVDVDDWWDERHPRTRAERLLEFLRLLASASESPLVVFFDEIDATLDLPFASEFFVSLRSMHNLRSTSPEYGRITICFAGVATAEALIRDKSLTPYNVGMTIELRDFDKNNDDLSSLVRAIGVDRQVAENVLERILDWTSGHPYLTLYLCQEAMNRGCLTQEGVDRLVDSLLGNLGSEVSAFRGHFQTVERFLELRLDHPEDAYPIMSRVLRGESVPDLSTRTCMDLKLAGIVKRDATGHLVSRNSLYDRIFTLTWAEARAIRRVLPRRQSRLAWLTAAVSVAFFLGAWFLWLQPDRLVRRLAEARYDYRLARDAYVSLRRLPGRADEAERLWEDLLAGYVATAWEQRDSAEANDKLAELKAIGQRAGRPAPSDRIPCRKSYYRFLAALLADDYAKCRAEYEASRVADVPNKRLVGLWVTYLERRSTRALQNQNRDEAILWLAHALAASDDEERRTRFRDLVGDYLNLRSTLWHAKHVNLVDFCPTKKGERIATASIDGTAWLWNWSSNPPTSRCLEHDVPIMAAVFSPKDDLIATAKNNGTVQFWDAHTGERVREFRLPQSTTDVKSLTFDAQGKIVIATFFGNNARSAASTEGAESGQLGWIVDDPITDVSFAGNGTVVAVANWTKGASVWTEHDGQWSSVRLPTNRVIYGVDLSEDGEVLATVGTRGYCQVWDVSDHNQPKPRHAEMRHGDYDEVWWVRFSGDRRLLLTATGDRSAFLRDVATATPLPTPWKADTRIMMATFCPDNQHVATAGMDGAARVWALDMKSAGREAVLKLAGEQLVLAWQRRVGLKVTDDGLVIPWPSSEQLP